MADKRQLFEGLKSVNLFNHADERQEDSKGISIIAFGKFYDNYSKDVNSDMIYDGANEFNTLYSDRYHAFVVHGDKYNYVHVLTLEALVENIDKYYKDMTVSSFPDMKKVRLILGKDFPNMDKVKMMFKL